LALTPPQYAAFQITPSPKFPHSSIFDPVTDFMRSEHCYVAGHNKMKINEDHGSGVTRSQIMRLHCTIRLCRDYLSDCNQHFIRHGLIHETAQRLLDQFRT
jgi:hypothetical protein